MVGVDAGVVLDPLLVEVPDVDHLLAPVRIHLCQSTV